MIAVIFEVEPSKDGVETYLSHAAKLKPLLTELDGFISIERFQSLTNPNKLVSLSFWRDEEAVRAWREQDSAPAFAPSHTASLSHSLDILRRYR